MIFRPLARFAALPLIAMALVAFAGIAGEMVEGDTLHLDRAILVALRDPSDLSHPIGPRWLVEVARDVTSLGSTAVLTGMTLAITGYLMLANKRLAALLVVTAIAGGAILSILLKLAFLRPRPDFVLPGAGLVADSFPSGHAMLSAVTYLTLGALLARMQTRRRIKAYVIAWATLATVLVGVSRVYLSVHWPTDVLAGWCIGAAWALLCWIAATNLERISRVDREPGGRAR